VLTLPTTGAYRLVVHGYANYDVTGSYSFRLLDVGAAATPQIGTSKAVVTVLLSDPRTTQTYVYYQTEPGTATANVDYVATPGAYLYFAPGVTSRQIVVPIFGDTTVEDDETFNIRLSSNNDTISDDLGVVTILNDDTQITAAIDDVNKLEGSGGGTTDFVFTLTLSAASSQIVTIDYQTADGTAAAGSDYTAANGTLSFAPGETSKSITVKVAADTDGEANETFFVNLSGPTNALIADGQGKGTILNDDAKVSISDVVEVEGDSGKTYAVFTVSLSTPSSLQTSVNYATANGSAGSPGDYTAASGTLTFDVGETTKTISIEVLRDGQAEGDETFYVDLTNASNATFAEARGTATIRNDDAAVSVQNAWITEGNSGTKVLKFYVSLPYATTNTVTVDYATSDGTATAGADYTAASGTLTFAPGETTKTVTVLVKGDVLNEYDDTLFLTLTDPSTGATIAQARGTGTTIDDDPAPTMSIGGASITEGDAGTVDLTFVVTLSATSGKPITVTYQTADGTAVASDDYDSATGPLSFAAGETSKTITVKVKGDVMIESDETLSVQLAGAVNATIARATAQGTILNDDVAANPAPTVVSYVVDDGTAQRSVVRSLTVTFSEVVTIAAGAFEVRNASGDLIPATLVAEVVSGRTVATLKFAGASLADGDYRLTILADRISDASGKHLDADAHDAALFDFYRYFGDLDGDRNVDALDYAKLRRAIQLHEYIAYLDADGDGDVDAADIAQFQARYGHRLGS